MKALLAEIERTLPDGGSWCDLPKAGALAALVVGLRPALVVEIGVWAGGSLIPMLLALKYNIAHGSHGKAIAIDPWSPSVSVIGESAPNVAWWGTVDHEQAHRTFYGRMEVLHVTALCEVWRRPSDDCTPPDAIDILHVDGSHTDQAMRDVDRYASNVRVGGILILDDVGWEGGGVQRALACAIAIGFRQLFPLGTGVVMQRVSRIEKIL